MHIFNKTNTSVDLLYYFSPYVKCIDVSGNPLNGYLVKTMLYKSPSAILHCIRLIGENVAGQAIVFHRRVLQKCGQYINFTYSMFFFLYIQLHNIGLPIEKLYQSKFQKFIVFHNIVLFLVLTKFAMQLILSVRDLTYIFNLFFFQAQRNLLHAKSSFTT